MLVKNGMKQNALLKKAKILKKVLRTISIESKVLWKATKKKFGFTYFGS